MLFQFGADRVVAENPKFLASDRKLRPAAFAITARENHARSRPGEQLSAVSGPSVGRYSTEIFHPLQLTLQALRAEAPDQDQGVDHTLIEREGLPCPIIPIPPTIPTTLMR